jgi:hypothetical protein
MRANGPILLLLTGLLFSSGGCVDTFPDKVALAPNAANVEVVSDPPNPDVYEPVGEVSAKVIAKEVGEAFREAANELRNKAAAKGASFVSIDDVSSRAAWDFSGRTVVTMAGTAYKPK